MVNDPIADLLTRIRNGRTARHEIVIMPYSKHKRASGTHFGRRRLLNRCQSAN